MPSELKKCRTCEEEFPATTDYFHRNGKWLYPQCKTCVAKSRNRTNREKRSQDSEVAAQLIGEIPPFDGTSQWFLENTAKFMTAIAKFPGDRDLQAAARAWSQLASSARGFYDQRQIETQVNDLMDRMAEMQRALKYGAPLASAEDLGSRPSTRPETPSN